jgi:hypothetical protein
VTRICPECGKREIGPRAAMCNPCGQKAVREYYFSRGICPACKRNELFGAERMCIECRARISERRIKRYHAQQEKLKAQASESHKRMYEKYKSQGICVRCKSRKAQEGYSTCKICTLKLRREQANEIPRSERVQNGLCYFCGQPLDRDGRSCTKCAERCTKIIAPHRGKNNKVWNDSNKAIFRKKESV